MTTSASLGPAPMTRLGQKNINKDKKENKMSKTTSKTFMELAIENAKMLEESPVGMVGRTKNSEAIEHIENSGLAEKFRKIVKELGGKAVARELLAIMDTKSDTVSDIGDTTLAKISEAKQTPESYLRDAGFKIKLEIPIKKGKELEFFKASHAEEAFEDLKTAGFGDKYNLDLVNKFIRYEQI